jgi:hypothetical protein
MRKGGDREMKAKAIIAMFVAIVFTLGVVGLSFAAEVKGTITKIEGNKVTVKDAAAKETTVDVKDAKGVKVGDTVTIKDGVITPTPPAKKKVTGC